ncbi:MAG: hypothetical protein WBX20_13725 [Terrimicrobiaceae bacterium]
MPGHSSCVVDPGHRCPNQRRLAASALGDVLFGLIMVLTMTLTAKLTTADDREGVTIFLGS